MQFLYFDGTNYRKLTGKIIKLKQEDLDADDWEISNPKRNKTWRKIRESEEFMRLVEVLSETEPV